MNISLQHTETRDFVHRNAGWTPDRELARRFVSGIEAVLFCLSHRLTHVQVAYEFTDRRMNFALPVAERCLGLLREQAGNQSRPEVALRTEPNP